MFHRQFRLDREDFYHIRDLLDESYPICEKMAELSSGSAITNELRLFVTMRMLAGASYLDMIWYEIDIDHVHELFVDTLYKLNQLNFLDILCLLLMFV